MKGPSPDAVQQAISTLFRSLNAENELELETEFPPSMNSFVNATERYIQATQLVRHAFLRELDDRSIYKDYNSHRPVGGLPVELLVEIFYLAAIDGCGDMGRVYDLSRVCVQWWQVTKAAPQLYTNIHVTDDPNVKYQLERSGNSPLSVTIRSRQDDCLSSWALDNFVTIIENEAHRLRRVKVEVAHDEWKVIAPCMAMPMTLLQEADLGVGQGSRDDETPALSFAAGSKLSTLRLSNLTLNPPRAGGLYGSLTRLELKCIHMPSPTILHYHLQLCPSLLELVVKSSFEGRTSIDNKAELPDSVVLPHLRVLELEHSFGPISGPFIQSIRVPNLKRLRVSEHHDSSASTLRMLSHPPLVPNGSPLLQSVLLNATFTSIEIRVWNNFLKFLGVAKPDEDSISVLADDELGLDLSVGIPNSSAVVDMLRHLHLPDVPFHVELLALIDGSSLLYLFPTATSILLYGDTGFMRGYVALLSGVDGNTGRKACPAVSELTLSTVTVGDETERQALEADDGLMEDIRRLVQVRRTMEGADAVARRNFRVTCHKESYTGERYLFDEASARFVDEEALAPALDDPQLIEEVETLTGSKSVP